MARLAIYDTPCHYGFWCQQRVWHSPTRRPAMRATDETMRPAAAKGAGPTAAVAAEARNLPMLGALVLLAAVQLMVVLDTTIVNVALPSIQDGLGFSVGGIAWVVNGYALTFGALLLLGGRSGDLLGRRNVFIAALGVFAAASLLGGLSTGPSLLIVARVLQGASAAFAQATALSLIISTFPVGPARNRAVGVFAAMEGLGAAAGLLLGGVLVDAASWRWVFFVSVPASTCPARPAPPSVWACSSSASHGPPTTAGPTPPLWCPSAWACSAWSSSWPSRRAALSRSCRSGSSPTATAAAPTSSRRSWAPPCSGCSFSARCSSSTSWATAR